MSSERVRSILLLNSSSVNCSDSILFHCAKYWAQQGSRVLYISKTPLKHLPLSVGNLNSSPNPDVFKLIQFMYLATWQELLQQLYSVHLRHKPVSVIIVQNLENYFTTDIKVPNHDDHVSLICASLLYAVSTCAKVLSQPAYLINEYVCESSWIERSIIKNYFHNIWELKTNKCENQISTELSKLSVARNEEIINYTFSENIEESLLTICEVIRSILIVS